MRLGDQPYQLPSTEPIHSELIKSAVQLERDICLISPTIRQEYLDRHTLDILFEMMGMDRRAVMVLSRNSDIRDRYESLEGAFKYSTGRWPLSSVKADGSLAARTQHYISKDAPPAVIYAKWATRLPNEEHAKTIQAVLYDESVGYDEERFDDFEEWREEAEIPTVVYYIRDPLGQTYERIKDTVDIAWAWTPQTLQEVVSRDQDSRPAPGEPTVPECTAREQDLLNNKAAGQTYETRVCQSGPVNQQFSEVWSSYETFASTVNKIGTTSLKKAKFYLRDTVAAFSRGLANLDQSNTYRAQHGRATTLSGRVGTLRQMKSNLSGDAQAGGTALQNAIYDIEDLEDLLRDQDNLAWKRGEALTAMLDATDSDETIIIVVPDDPEAKALRADLHIHRREFWDDAKDAVTICTPTELSFEPSVDTLLLYGPPKYADRWLLRSPHGASVEVLAYPHELGLLYSQAVRLNNTMESVTSELKRAHDEEANELLSGVSEYLPAELPSTSETEDEPPTVAGPGVDGIRIRIPDKETIAKGSKEYERNETQDPSKRERLMEIIEGQSNKSKSDTGDYRPSDSGSNTESGSKWTRRDIDGCIELVGQDGYRMADRPSETVEIVRMDAKVRESKPLEKVNVGEFVVSVRDRMEIRKHVERQLYDMGEAQVVISANKWKDHLQREIEARGDSFDDFVERIEATDISSKQESTYRSWYHGDLTMPKSKDSLYYIAEAYDLGEIKSQLNVCWKANNTVQNVKEQLIKKWLDEAEEQLLSKGSEIDDIIENKQGLDIRASDFEKSDEKGEPLVLAHKIIEINYDVSCPSSYLGVWRPS